MKEEDRGVVRNMLMMVGTIDTDDPQELDDATYYKGVADGLARARTLVKSKAAEYRKREKDGKAPVTADGALRAVTRSLGEQIAAFDNSNAGDGEARKSFGMMPIE